MEEGKAIKNTKYLRIIPIIAKYIKNKNIPPIFKYKYPIFASTGNEGRIHIFSNSLEHMGTFSGHQQGRIWCLCPISHKILASGSSDNNIKIWNIENRTIMSTLYGHANYVSALCNLDEGVLVSGSEDRSLIIWSLYENPGSRVLTGHNSVIKGITRINKREIISGEWNGDLRFWDIYQGICIRHISPMNNSSLWQMKQHMGEVVVSYRNRVNIWGAANNWEFPLKQFGVCGGLSIEFLSLYILLRGMYKDLEFIYSRELGCSLPSTIHDLHPSYIYAIQRIAKNIVITASDYGFLKVIDPILRKCYLKFEKGGYLSMNALAYFY